MFLPIILFCLLHSVITTNKEGCGCNLNRGETIDRENLYTKGIDGHCPAGYEENRIDSGLYSDNNAGGMALVPGGVYQLGTDNVIIETDKEGPKRIVTLDSFYIDKYAVTNRDFNYFVTETNYKTDAEGFGDSFVFQMFMNDTFKESLQDFRVVDALWWYKVLGADWRHPYGPDSDIEGLQDHPVTHVSWKDAQAYCKWKGGRLPTEAEWEAACRGGHRDTTFPWGNKLYPGKQHMANIWHGTFPIYNSAKDGYVGTNPVDKFPPNDFGLYDMVGNVWEWTEDAWSKNNVNEKVRKGGSHLCHASYCYRYRCSARSQTTDDSSAGNLGFRCAKSLK